jgi:hypothetical protein
MFLVVLIPTISAEHLKNSNCLVIGRTTNTWFSSGKSISFRIAHSLLLIMFLILAIITPRILHQTIGTLYVVLAEILIRCEMRVPIRRDAYVGFGTHLYEAGGGVTDMIPASGWIRTIGDNGVVEYTGSFWGTGNKMFSSWPHSYSLIGVIGFRGLKLMVLNPILQRPTYFIGYAEQISIDTRE